MMTIICKIGIRVINFIPAQVNYALKSMFHYP